MEKDYRRGFREEPSTGGPGWPPPLGTEVRIGRARLLDDGRTLTVTIPADRQLFTMFFIGIWLSLWTMGGLMAMRALLSGEAEAKLFLMFWLVGWFLGEVFALATLWWSVFGREIVMARPEEITITRRAWFFSKSRAYSALAPESAPASRFKLAPLRGASGRGPTMSLTVGSATAFFGQGLSKDQAGEISMRLRERSGLKVEVLDEDGRWRGVT